MSTKEQSNTVFNSSAAKEQQPEDDEQQSNDPIIIECADSSDITITGINVYDNNQSVVDESSSTVTPEVAKIIGELEQVKNILYDRAKYYNSLSNPAKKLIPTNINARNTFLFQERLRLVVELGKVELNYLQEISKVNKQIYDMVMKSKQHNPDNITEDQENLIVKKVINKIKKMV